MVTGAVHVRHGLRVRWRKRVQMVRARALALGIAGVSGLFSLPAAATAAANAEGVAEAAPNAEESPPPGQSNPTDAEPLGDQPPRRERVLLPAERPYSPPPPAPNYGKLSGVLFRPWGVALGMGGGGLYLKDEAASRVSAGSGAAFTMDGRFAFLHALWVSAGFGVGGASDNAQFSEEACSILEGECGSYESSVSVLTLNAKAGALLRTFIPISDWALQTTFVAGVGHRGVWYTRQIANCGDCTSQDLDIDGGYLLSPEIDLSFTSNGDGRDRIAGALGLRFEYEYFLAGDLQSAFWIKLHLEVL